MHLAALLTYRQTNDILPSNNKQGTVSREVHMAAQNQQVERYFDALIQSYNVLRDAAEKGRERGSAVYQELATEVANGQRETLELAKKVAGQPTDIGQNWSAILEATVKAQEPDVSGLPGTSRWSG